MVLLQRFTGECAYKLKFRYFFLNIAIHIPFYLVICSSFHSLRSRVVIFQLHKLVFSAIRAELEISQIFVHTQVIFNCLVFNLFVVDYIPNSNLPIISFFILFVLKLCENQPKPPALKPVQTLPVVSLATTSPSEEEHRRSTGDW